jgi:hypothetical protein
MFFSLAFWLRRETILALLLLAFVGHALPVLWAAGAAIFLAAARRFPRWAFPLTVAFVAIAGFWLRSWPFSYWSILQVTDMTGFDQLGVFTARYFEVIKGVADFVATTV